MKRLLFILLLLLPIASAVTLQEAQDAYFNASLDIQHMNSLNLPTASLEDALLRMGEALNGTNITKLKAKAYILNESGEADKIALAQELYRMVNVSLQTGVNPGVNYSFVVEKSLWVREMKSKAFAMAELLTEANAAIHSVNESLNLSAVNATMLKAYKAFAGERYDEIPGLVKQAKDQLESAQVEAARQRAFLRLARRNIINYVQDHWRGLLLTLIIIIVLGTWLFLESRLYAEINRVKRLRSEVQANVKLLRETQEDYFGGKLGSGTYKSRMELYKLKRRELGAQLKVAEKLVSSYKKTSLLLRFRQS